jgi:glycyl-tRNA synthetase beta chain
MKAHDLLVGVGVEEIPDWMIPGALEDFKRRFLEVLEKFQLRDGVEVETHATPRRLVLAARNIPAKQRDSREQVTGPPVSAGPGAAEGFARKMGVGVGALKLLKTAKGQYLAHTRKVKGRKTRDILSELLPGVILGISWPKTMTWTGASGPRFIRPIRRLVAIYGGRVVPFEIAGIKSGNLATGHRRLGKDRIRVRACARTTRSSPPPSAASASSRGSRNC